MQLEDLQIPFGPVFHRLGRRAVLRKEAVVAEIRLGIHVTEGAHVQVNGLERLEVHRIVGGLALVVVFFFLAIRRI